MNSTLNTHMRLEPAPKFCPMCGAPLKTLRTRRRTVHTLTSTLEVTLVEKACGDTGCALCGVALKPPLPLALPYLHYGVDVTLHAATERERGDPRQQSLRPAAQPLNRDPPHRQAGPPRRGLSQTRPGS